MMSFEVDDPNSTPKLTLSKPPYCKLREPLHMQTPPLRPSVSIPFHWEEAPGKPRSATGAGGSSLATPPSSKNRAARSLELPPRLLHNDSNMTMMPSPTTVLDGPYVGRSLSLACTFSFRKGQVEGREEAGPRPVKRGSALNFGSGRWGSFKDKGNLDFWHSLGGIFKSEKNVKITRVGRRKSFFSLSSVNSNLWGDIYTSFKQAVPWKRGR